MCRVRGGDESDVKHCLDQVELVGTDTEPSLFKALRMTWNYDFWVAGLWKLVNDMVVFIGPLMLQALIRYPDRGSHQFFFNVMIHKMTGHRFLPALVSML